MIHTHLERTPIWPNYSLPPLNKSLFIPNETPDLDNIACHGVVQYFHRLSDSDASRKEFEEVAGFENNVGVICLSGGPDGHGAVDQVECACYALYCTK